MSLVVGGARVYYYDDPSQGYVCYCTMKHVVQLVTNERDAAEYYLRHGLIQFQSHYTSGVIGRAAQFSGVEKHQYLQWCNKIRAKFKDVVIY